MKLLLEVKDKKADFILELLEQFDFVKVIPVHEAESSMVSEPVVGYEVPSEKKHKSRKEKKKEQFLNDLRESVEYVNRAKKGLEKEKTLKQFLNEL